MSDEKVESTGSFLIIDLGKQKKKRIKALRKGKGKLADRLNAVLAEFKENGTLTAETHPVLILREKKKKSKGFRLF
jgi:hypothetical protein